MASSGDMTGNMTAEPATGQEVARPMSVLTRILFGGEVMNETVALVEREVERKETPLPRGEGCQVMLPFAATVSSLTHERAESGADAWSDVMQELADAEGRVRQIADQVRRLRARFAQAAESFREPA